MGKMVFRYYLYKYIVPALALAVTVLFDAAIFWYVGGG